MTHVEYHAIETENEVLRNELRKVRDAGRKLCDTIDLYTRQGVSRSILLKTVSETRTILGGAKTTNRKTKMI